MAMGSNSQTEVRIGSLGIVTVLRGHYCGNGIITVT